MFEHMDVRVRAGPSSARSTGNRDGFTVPASVPAHMVLVTFAETKVTSARSALQLLILPSLAYRSSTQSASKL